MKRVKRCASIARERLHGCADVLAMAVESQMREYVGLVEKMLNRHEHLYDQYPRKVAMDGGFASKENLQKAKGLNISDVRFAKKRGLQVSDMCRSPWVYNQLRRFRAGVEAGISFLKRCFGLDRCTWKGQDSFKSYV